MTGKTQVHIPLGDQVNYRFFKAWNSRFGETNSRLLKKIPGFHALGISAQIIDF
jgi:hypothetical protein